MSDDISRLVPHVKNVNLKQVHPEVLLRWASLASFFEERYRGRPLVVSGARSKEHQERLYANYKRGAGPLAANPNRKWNPADKDSGQGSRHQVQKTAQGVASLALDIRMPPGMNTSSHWAFIHDNAAQFGCGFWLMEPYHRGYQERWHMTCQPLGSKKVDEWMPIRIALSGVDKSAFEEFTGLRCLMGPTWRKSAPPIEPPSKPSPSSKPVKWLHKDPRVGTLQNTLGELKVDGLYGNDTKKRIQSIRRALKRWDSYTKGPKVV